MSANEPLPLAPERPWPKNVIDVTPNAPSVIPMKHLNEHERILTVFGGLLIIAALTLSVATELNARRYLAEYRKYIEAGPVVQQSASTTPAPSFRHVGYEQQTLASRWSFPDGHGTLGAGFALFGMLLVAAPRAAARKRNSVELKI